MIKQPQIIQISEIKEVNRFREDYSHVESLVESIKRYGLLQPLTLDANNVLIDGGSRLRALKQLGWTEVPVFYREELSQETIHEMELEANIKRKDFSWQERVLGIAHIHTLKERQAIINKHNWIREMTGELLGIHRASVNNALKLAEWLQKDVLKTGIYLCDSPTEAIKYILKKQVDELVAEQARRTLLGGSFIQPPKSPSLTVPDYDNDEQSLELTLPEPSPLNEVEKEQARERYLSNPLNDPEKFEEYFLERKQLEAERLKERQTINLSYMLRNQSCLDYMKEGLIENEDSPWIDHIITDPPYGIDMDMLEQASGGIQNIDDVKNEHNVQDNEQLFKDFIPLAFKVLHEGGYLAMWCDIMQWQNLYDLCINAGFKVQRWPVVWNKLGPCKNGSAYVNFTKDFEICMICRKSKATLNHTSPTSIVSASHDEMRDLFGHAFVKPFEVWKFLYEHISRPNQLIYEPFAGRGSGVLSGLRLGRRIVATELQTNHYNHLIQNVKQHYTTILGESTTFC